MLTDSEPRGLPGCRIERVAFQRRHDGHPLDDVIVYARDRSAEPIVLEIQVKRALTFAPSDPEFRDVVGQIADASRKADFKAGRRQLAIAIARTSRKISGPYQDVLTWARQMESAEVFFANLRRRGAANEDMRRFVETMRDHLRSAGAGSDDETVWNIMRRLQILDFDFTATGSVSELLARDRASRALHEDDVSRAGSLWNELALVAMESAIAGGAQDRAALVESLGAYCLAASPRHAAARARLADASAAALNDIDDQVGGATLGRPARLAQVRDALEISRLVLICGEGGVGKSAILKHFAVQTGEEAPALVLSPRRVLAKGWLGIAAALKFEGSARDFLSDLAVDGSAMLYIDNVERFGPDERPTVVDLVRAAAQMPGIDVVITARSAALDDDADWLPRDALQALGPPVPILVDELSDDEVDDLRQSAPQLGVLLADGHPAKAVARNLYRLGRLARLPLQQGEFHTEVDLATRWWETADGEMGESLRDRKRVLHALAAEAIGGAIEFDTSQFPPLAVNALIASGTLREIRPDRVVFRHDVLQDWAVGGLLSGDPGEFRRLNLTQPISPLVSRGLSLAARHALERGGSQAWIDLLGLVSAPPCHSSWRRAVLLAPIRSELGTALLRLLQSELLAGDSSLLRELLRTMRAVDVRPASEMVTGAGLAHVDVYLPIGPSWHRLLQWLVPLAPTLPAAVIRDVVPLYVIWSTIFLGRDAVTPVLVQQIHDWLLDFEPDDEPGQEQRPKRLQGLSASDRKSLGFDLRTGFLLHCNSNPPLAREYVERLRRRLQRGEHIDDQLQFFGRLAEAAPAELAAFVAEWLIPRPGSEDARTDPYYQRPFGYADMEFVPASPAKGPFFELLCNSPDDGLQLVRQLVDHAISIFTEGRADLEPLVIPFPGGDRQFAWWQSYAWSRGVDGGACVGCALLALEAWGHWRIERRNAPIEEVVADILGTGETPAAYVLVIVDLLLSHWPASRDVAVPFLACPELLGLDRERQAIDITPFLGGSVRTAAELAPSGATIASLNQRPSRGRSLDSLLAGYITAESSEARNRLRILLSAATARLGTPTANSSFRDPAFMADHAVNLTAPENWTIVEVPGAPGTVKYRYAPPEAERARVAQLQAGAMPAISAAAMMRDIDSVLDAPGEASSHVADQAAEWAQDVPIEAFGPAPRMDRLRDQYVAAAAMIVLRDGSAELLARYTPWALDVCQAAILSPEDPGDRSREGIRFNVPALGFSGLASHTARGWRPSPSRESRPWWRCALHILTSLGRPRADHPCRALLEAAARRNPAAAHGFGAVISQLAQCDDRLPVSILRIALAATIRDVGDWHSPQEAQQRAEELHQARMAPLVARELRWLSGHGSEPAWPSFPPAVRPPRRRGFLLGDDQHPQEAPAIQPSRAYLDHQAAALWIAFIKPLTEQDQLPRWLPALLGAYAEWTGMANGVGLPAHLEPGDRPHEWNAAYFLLLARSLRGARLDELEPKALSLVLSLPEDVFFEAAPVFLLALDLVTLGHNALALDCAVTIRQRVADRLLATAGWRQDVRRGFDRVERGLAAAISSVFFNVSGMGAVQCYLEPAAGERVESFLPLLLRLVEASPSAFVATLSLNLLERTAHPSHLAHVLEAAQIWLQAHPGSTAFWLDQSVGPRLCRLIQRHWRADPSALSSGAAARIELDALLPKLVALGVSEAAALERLFIAG